MRVTFKSYDGHAEEVFDMPEIPQCGDFFTFVEHEGNTDLDRENNEKAASFMQMDTENDGTRYFVVSREFYSDGSVSVVLRSQTFFSF